MTSLVLTGLVGCTQPAEPEVTAATVAPASPSPTPSATASQTPAPTPKLSPAIPATIDVPYTEGVLAALDGMFASALGRIEQTGTVDQAAVDLFHAGWHDAGAQQWIAAWQTDLDAPFASPPLPPITTVTALITARPDCIFAAVDKDLAPLYLPNSGALTSFDGWHVALRPLPEGADPNGLNPTPWEYVYDGFERDFLPPEDPCQ